MRVECWSTWSVGGVVHLGCLREGRYVGRDSLREGVAALGDDGLVVVRGAAGVGQGYFGVGPQAYVVATAVEDGPQDP